MIRLARLDRVETKLRNELASKREEYKRKAQAECLAVEFRITYDKACELLHHYDHEQAIRHAESVLGMNRQRIKYVPRDTLDGLLAISDTPLNGFELESVCDVDD